MSGFCAAGDGGDPVRIPAAGADRLPANRIATAGGWCRSTALNLARFAAMLLDPAIVDGVRIKGARFARLARSILLPPGVVCGGRVRRENARGHRRRGRTVAVLNQSMPPIGYPICNEAQSVLR